MCRQRLQFNGILDNVGRQSSTKSLEAATGYKKLAIVTMKKKDKKMQTEENNTS